MTESRAHNYVVLRNGCHPRIEIEIKRSLFIAYGTRVDDEQQARDFFAEINHEHRQATHVCTAFVCNPDRDIQRSNDDGEPSGTAGIPMLTAITERQTSPGVTDLSDIAVAVVRYFGGVKLGAGGLVQAYSDSTVATLDAGEYVTRQRMVLFCLPAPFSEAAKLETTLRSQGFYLDPTEYDARGALIHLAVADDEIAIAEMKQYVAEQTAGAANLTMIGTRWVDLA